MRAAWLNDASKLYRYAVETKSCLRNIFIRSAAALVKRAAFSRLGLIGPVLP